MKFNVLLDTSFFIRLLNEEDELHYNAVNYFRYFLEEEIALKVFTISIAEYCVKGRIDELPLRNMQVIPFNLDHALRTGAFAEVIFILKRRIDVRFEIIDIERPYNETFGILPFQ